MPSQQFQSRDRLIFTSVALLFVVGGGFYSSFVLDSSFRYPDESDYFALAKNLADLKGYSVDGKSASASRPPGYPVMLAPLFSLIQSIDAVRIAQFMLIVLSCWWLGRLASEQTSTSVWRCATIIIGGVCAYPVLIYAAGTLFPQIALLMCLSALLVHLTRPQNSWFRATVVGALAAFVAQISPTALMAIPVAVVYTFWSTSWTRRQSLIVIISAAFVIAIWPVRNWIVLGEPIVFSTNLAENIDNAVLALDPLDESDIRPPNTTMGYAIERVQQLADSPMTYLAKVTDYFAYRNDLYIHKESTLLRDVVMLFSYYALLAIVLLRLLFIRRLALSHAELLIFTLYLGTALFHALVFTRIRYRLPFDFLLLLPATNMLLLIPSLLRDSGFATLLTPRRCQR